MEVNQSSYKKYLLPILQHIANASFVSFDLEMSGIHKISRFGPKASGHDNGKPSLQQLYEEIRIAAETFQVLQIGITCVEEDREKGEPRLYHGAVGYRVTDANMALKAYRSSV